MGQQSSSVRFMVENRIPGADEEEEPERQRLHRRDTPHHLKNKRINQQVIIVLDCYCTLLSCLIYDIYASMSYDVLLTYIFYFYTS